MAAGVLLLPEVPVSYPLPFRVQARRIEDEDQLWVAEKYHRHVAGEGLEEQAVHGTTPPHARQSMINRHCKVCRHIHVMCQSPMACFVDWKICPKVAAQMVQLATEWPVKLHICTFRELMEKTRAGAPGHPFPTLSLRIDCYC